MNSLDPGEDQGTTDPPGGGGALYRVATPTSALGATSSASSRRFLLVLFVLAALLALLSAFVLFAPGFLFVVVASEADHIINTAVTLIAGATALLAWIRYRETGEPDSIFQAAAFLVLFVGSVITLAVLVTGWQMELGFDRSAPGQAPLYLWTVQRSLAAPLLVVGALTALRSQPGNPRIVHHPRVALTAALAPAAVLVLVAIGLFAVHNVLPPLIPPATLDIITQRLDAIEPTLLSPPMLVTQLALGGLFLAAGLGYGLAYVQSGGHRRYHRFLSVGLVIAAFSQLHFAAVPGAYSDLLTSGDVLRMTFYAVVAVGVAAAAREDLVELRQANVTLQRLRVADAERIALSERARLAREIHDGLVQELWLARLTHGQLLQGLHVHGHREDIRLPPELDQAAQQVDRALENALAEARQAVVTLQPSPDASFGSLLRRVVEDYGDRFGLDVECTTDGEPVSLDADRQAEVLRITREALNNARKHADATLVRVNLDGDSSKVRLTIADNGKGFDPDQTGRRGFGLTSMHDRAAEIGAELTIDSAPMDGTRVTVELPR